MLLIAYKLFIMKSLKNLFLILPAISLMVSCGEDDYSEAYVDTEVKIALVGTLTINSTQAPPGQFVNFEATMPQSFSVSSTVTVRATNADNGNYKVAMVQVPAGQTTLSGHVEMPAMSLGGPHDFFGLDNAVYVEIDGVALNEGEDPYTLSSNRVYLTLLDNNGLYDVAYPADYDGDGVIEPWLSLSLDWEGPYDVNDLDMYVIDEAWTTIYEDSWSTTRFEGDWFNGNWYPDGAYVVYVDIWFGETPISYRFTATDHHNVTTVVTGELEESSIIAKITKSGGDTNDITYVVEPY